MLRNLCSNGDRLSFRQIREKGTSTFRSTIGNKATPLGHCHLAESLTKATPNLQETKLRIVAWSSASCTIRGDFKPPRKHASITQSYAGGFVRGVNQAKGTSFRSLSRSLVCVVRGCPLDSAST